MSNAIGYVLTNFVWFGDLVLSVFSGKSNHDPFTGLALLGATGVVAFVIGAILSEIRKNRRSYFVLLTILIAVIEVALSGALRGQIHGALLSAIPWGTLALQAIIAVGALYWASGARMATALMVPLWVSFCLWSTLDATMSFQDVWL